MAAVTQQAATSGDSRMGEPGPAASRLERFVWWAEVALLTLIALWAIRLHFSVLLEAKGLWRDEVNTVNLAQSRSVLDMFAKMAFDSSGLFWLLVVRAWSALGLNSDLSLRALGFVVGIAIVAALIWSGRKLGVRVPILALGLFSTGPSSVAYGDSLRAYGCATLWVLLTAALVFELSTSYTRARVIAAAVAGVAAVHCVFASAALVAACYAGGAVSAALERRTRELRALAVAASATLVSLALYYPTSLRVAAWVRIKGEDVGWSAAWWGFVDAMGLSQPWSSATATIVAFLGFVAAAAALLRRKRSLPARGFATAVFILTVAMVGLAGQVTYFKLLSYTLYPWHYLPVFGLLCLLADAGLQLWTTGKRYSRMIRLGAVALYVLAIAPAALAAAETRRTDLDVIAAGLTSAAGPDDLIVVHPFYYGISFSRYYAGQAPWTTLPQIADHSLHRWDLIKEKMQEVAPDEEVLRRVEATLTNGHRVWLVGAWRIPTVAEGRVARLPPAPHSRFGWDERAYQLVWTKMLGQVIGTSAARLAFIPLHVEGAVNAQENVSLAVAEGRQVHGHGDVRPGDEANALGRVVPEP